MTPLMHGHGGTVSTAVPDLVSDVAVIVALPAPIAVTTPVALTVATAVLELVQVTTRPVSTLLEASRATAVACVLSPIATVGAANVTVTVATGSAVTEMSAVPLWPSLVAVIVAVPTASDVTRPLAFTVATAVLELLHVTARPVSTLFDASRVTAVVFFIAMTLKF